MLKQVLTSYFSVRLSIVFLLGLILGLRGQSIYRSTTCYLDLRVNDTRIVWYLKETRFEKTVPCGRPDKCISRYDGKHDCEFERVADFDAMVPCVCHYEVDDPTRGIHVGISGWQLLFVFYGILCFLWLVVEALTYLERKNR